MALCHRLRCTLHVPSYLTQTIYLAPLSSACIRNASTESASVSYQQYTLPNDLRITQVDGVLRKPRLSARRAAAIKRSIILASTLDSSALKWNEAWDKPAASVVMRTPKGTRAELRQKERVASITAAIQESVQNKKYADYKKTLPPKPPAEGLIRWVKKNAWEKE